MLSRVHVLRLLGFFSLSLLAGCAAASIESEKVPGYQITSDKILILEPGGMNYTPGTFNSFNRKFWDLLSLCGIGSAAEQLPNPDSMDGAEREKFQRVHAEFIRKFKPDVMQVSFKSMQQLQKFGAVRADTIRISYVLTLQNWTGRQFWTSTVDLLPENIGQDDAPGSNRADLLGAVLANSVFNRMKKDGLLPQCPDQTP